MTSGGVPAYRRTVVQRETPVDTPNSEVEDWKHHRMVFA